MLRQPRIGFIGLGVMGQPMAMNLVRAGYSLVVQSRTPDRAGPLATAGASVVPDARAAAEQSDVLITVLPDSVDVGEVAEGEGGLFDGAHRGLTWIDMSSISPAVSRQLVERANHLGIDCLDAPVSGGEAGAVAGTLSIMVGGPTEVYDRCLPILGSMGSYITHVGDTGAGQVAKLCNQIIVGCTIAAVAEAMVLATKASVDPGRVRTALLGGFAQSKVLDIHGQRMLQRTFEPGFRSRLHQKDLVNALEAGRSYGAALIMTLTVKQLLQSLINFDKGDLDHAAVIEVYEQLANLGGLDAD